MKSTFGKYLMISQVQSGLFSIYNYKNAQIIVSLNSIIKILLIYKYIGILGIYFLLIFNTLAEYFVI